MENVVNRSTTSANVEKDEAFNLALTATSSSVLITALDTATQLDLFEIISKAGEGATVSASNIVSQLPNSGPPEAAAKRLDCLLRLLASYSLLTCSEKKLANGGIETRYGLAPAGKYFVRDDSGASLASEFHRLQAAIMGNLPSKYFKDAVLGGDYPFKRAYGMSAYDHMKSDPEFLRIFHDYMTNFSLLVMTRVCVKYNGFQGLHSIVNVGGGSGATLDVIISRYPSIRGINFDLPEVIDAAPSYKGIHHVGGDMFVQIPKGDATLMKFILHNWTDDQCLQLLNNCYKALPKMGKVILLEYILPSIPQDDVDSKMVSQYDFIMLMVFGSRERTKNEFEALAKKSGFSEFKVVCSAYCIHVMELIKSE